MDATILKILKKDKNIIIKNDSLVKIYKNLNNTLNYIDDSMFLNYLDNHIKIVSEGKDEYNGNKSNDIYQLVNDTYNNIITTVFIKESPPLKIIIKKQLYEHVFNYYYNVKRFQHKPKQINKKSINPIKCKNNILEIYAHWVKNK